MMAMLIVDINADAIIIDCCPACEAPAIPDKDDGSGSHCSSCDWRGDGYATGAPWYPETVQRVKPWKQVPEFLSGGRLIKKRFIAAEPTDEVLDRMAAAIWESFIDHGPYDHASVSEKAAYKERVKIALATMVEQEQTLTRKEPHAKR